MVFNVEFIKTVIEIGVDQIKKERLCLVGCQGKDGSVCLGRAENPRMIRMVGKKGIVMTDTPEEITFLSYSCPVIREPRSVKIG